MADADPDYFILRGVNGDEKVPVGFTEVVPVDIAAEAMGLPIATIRRFHRDGLIRSVQIGGGSYTTIQKVESALIGMMETPKRASEDDIAR